MKTNGPDIHESSMKVNVTHRQAHARKEKRASSNNTWLQLKDIDLKTLFRAFSLECLGLVNGSLCLYLQPVGLGI